MYALSRLRVAGVYHSEGLRLVRDLHVVRGCIDYDVIRDVKLIVHVHYLLLLGRVTLTVL